MTKVQRFEFRDDKSNKFWEIYLDSNSHTVRFGRIGTEGQTKSKSFSDIDAARKSAEKLIDQKLAKGYVKVKASGKASANKKNAPNEKKVARHAAHNWPPDLLADFEEQIKKHDLTDFQSELLQIARPKLALTWSEPVLKRLTKGISRIGGAPDVSSIDEWQSPSDGKYGIFYFQINMRDVPDPSDFGLPLSGLLSLYVGNQNMVNQWDCRSSITFNQKTDALIRFPLPELKEYCDDDLAKDHVPTCSRPPRKLKIRKAVWLPNKFAPKSIAEAGGNVENAYFDLQDHYGGIIDMCIPADAYGYKDGWTCLFRLHSCQYFAFGDCGKEYIWVRNRNGGLDFSKATADYDDY